MQETIINNARHNKAFISDFKLIKKKNNYCNDSNNDKLNSNDERKKAQVINDLQ